MKSAGAIKHKLKQVHFRYMKLKLKDELSVCPGNCAYNASLTHPVANDAPVGVCLNRDVQGTSPQLPLCDAKWMNRAPTCPHFEVRRSKEDVKHSFCTELEAMPLSEIARNYPEMAALLWCLGEDTLEDTPPSDAVPPISEATGLHAGVLPGTPETVASHAGVSNGAGRSLSLTPEGGTLVQEPSGEAFVVPGSDMVLTLTYEVRPAPSDSEPAGAEPETPMPWWSRLLGTLR